MPYFLNTPQDQQAMLAAIGAKSIDELFDAIPAELQLGRSLNLPAALSELELTQHFGELAAKNVSTADRVCFLGGGAYDHFIPAAVDQLAGRGEYYTSYTPYQAEASQGTLQAVFEYQTLVTQLFGMEVSNASLYDGATAATEAVLMCLNATGRSKVVVAESVNPEYREVLRTYLAHASVDIVTVPTPSGRAEVAEIAARIDGATACVLIQTP
ncbi:MAG TPA: glycine dehydrogenase, partial [Pirellulales bacterium]